MNDKTNSVRIEAMIAEWNRNGRAFSHIQNDDSDFFTATGMDAFQVGTGSQCGNDMVYFDTNRYESATGAMRLDEKNSIFPYAKNDSTSK